MLSTTGVLLDDLSVLDRWSIREVLLRTTAEDLQALIWRISGCSMTITSELIHSIPCSRQRLHLVMFCLISFSHFRGPFYQFGQLQEAIIRIQSSQRVLDMPCIVEPLWYIFHPVACKSAL